MNDARIVLIVQAHELISQIENTLYLFGGDIEGRKRAEGCIAYARKVSDPFNYNGPTRELADAQAEIARLRGALEVLETDAHFIFNNPPGETSQDVRDVIEWFAGSIRVALEQAK